MELKRIEIENTTFTFCCNSRSTRYGFAHDCTMFVGGYVAAEVSAYYLNRTWEAYRFQTVQQSAIYKVMQDRKENMLQAFKEAHGYKKMTASRRADFEQEAAADHTLQIYEAAYQKLK